MTEENTPQKVNDQSDQENILGLPDEVAQELEKLPPEAKQIMRLNLFLLPGVEF